MVTVSKIFRNAKEKHAEGQLAEAAALYQQILTVQPSHAEVLHRLGTIFHHSGQFQQAIETLGKSAALNPHNVAVQNDLGNAYAALGLWPEAINAYQTALQHEPENATALANLGVAFKAGEQWEAALEVYQKSLKSNPQSAETHFNLGNLWKEKDDLDQAIASYRRALALQPDHYEATNNLGIVLKSKGSLKEAVEIFQKILSFRSDSPAVLCNLGSALRQWGNLEEAEKAFKASLKLPDGKTLSAYSGLGLIYWERGEFLQAGEWFAKAFRTDPDNPDLRYNKAFYSLLRGEWEAGWIFYESRWETESGRKRRRSFSQPQWKGQLLNGESILLHCEQGMGDSIHFVCYAALIAERGGEVMVQCPDGLLELFQGVEGVSRVVDPSEKLPTFDYHIPMMSVARVFKTTLDSIPQKIPYINVDIDRKAQWENKLGVIQSRPRIGLVWAGNPEYGNDRNRSIPLLKFKQLFSLDDVQFFTLQKGRGAQEVSELGWENHFIDHTKELANYSDTAALLLQLDLVISVDTSVAHLGGALGKPVWTLIPYVPDWRWLEKRTDTPWYPTMRLFRQPKLGDWDSVILDVRRALQEWVENSSFGNLSTE